MNVLDRSHAPTFHNHSFVSSTKKNVSKVSNFVISNLPLMLAGGVIGGSFSYQICSALAITAVASTTIITAAAIIGAICLTTIFNKLQNSGLTKFTPNIRHRIGKVWEVKNFQDKAIVEAALHKVISELKSIEITIEGETRNIFEIVEIQAQRNKDLGFQFDDINSVIKSLGNGLCFGQSRVQLDYIHQGSQLDGATMHKLPINNREKVVYYQILQYAEALLYPSKRDIVTQAWSIDPKLLLHVKFKEQCWLKIIEILQTPKDTKYFNVTPSFSTKISPREFQEIFNETTKDLPKNVATGGYARLKADENTPSHAVFFSLYKDKYYIQDTLTQDQGFFEFSKKEAFFEGFSKQVGLHFDIASLMIYGF